MNEQAMRDALGWYEQQVSDCRKITADGEIARHALDNDGGLRARAALASRVDSVSAPVATSLVDWERVALDMFAIVNHPVKAARVWASYDIKRIREAVERFTGAKSTQKIEARNAAPVGVSPVGASENASRYQWMRKTFVSDDDTWPDDVADAKTGEELDRAIDVAMGKAAAQPIAPVEVTDAPALYPTRDAMVIDLLIHAGHCSAHQVNQARAIAAKIVAVPVAAPVAAVTDAKPLFWYRPRSDGFYEGPIHNAQIEKVRAESGAWVPLFDHAAQQSLSPVAVAWQIPHTTKPIWVTCIDQENAEFCRSIGKTLRALGVITDTPAPVAASEPPLSGVWRFNNGVFCNGSLRIAREDWDTPPSDDVRAEIAEWIVNTLNAAKAAARPVADTGAVHIPAPGIVDHSHPNQAYVTYGFRDEAECLAFMKVTRRDQTLYEHPAAPPCEAAEDWTPERAYHEGRGLYETAMTTQRPEGGWVFFGDLTVHTKAYWIAKAARSIGKGEAS